MQQSGGTRSLAGHQRSFTRLHIGSRRQRGPSQGISEPLLGCSEAQDASVLMQEPPLRLGRARLSLGSLGVPWGGLAGPSGGRTCWGQLVPRQRAGKPRGGLGKSGRTCWGAAGAWAEGCKASGRLGEVRQDLVEAAGAWAEVTAHI